MIHADVAAVPISIAQMPFSSGDSDSGIGRKISKVLGKAAEVAAKIVVLVVGYAILTLLFIPLCFAEVGMRSYYALREKFAKVDALKPKILLLSSPEVFLFGGSTLWSVTKARRRLMSEYNVEFHTVSNIQQANEHLKRSSDVAAVWFSAHSNDAEIYFDYEKYKDDGIIYEGNVKQLDFSKLASNAPIVFESCSAGNEDSGEASIARKVAEVAKGHKVFAATCTITDAETHITSEPGKPLEVSWRRLTLVKDDTSFLDTFIANLWSTLLALTPTDIGTHPWITADISTSYVA